MMIPPKVRKDILERDIERFKKNVKNFRFIFTKHLEKEKVKNKDIEELFNEVMAGISLHKSYLENYIKTGSEKDWDNAMLVLGDLIRNPLHKLENKALKMEDRELHGIIVDFECRIFEYIDSLKLSLKSIVKVMKETLRSFKDN